MVRRSVQYSIRQREACSNWNANWSLEACHEIGGFFQRDCTITQNQPDELGGGLFTRKVAAHPYRLADLRVKALDALVV